MMEVVRKIVFLSIVVAVALWLMMLAAGKVEAQQNWIQCKHIPTGNIQMFPGMSCPQDWVRV